MKVGHDTANRVLSGNRQFDSIVDVSFGMSILMLDETFSEASEFIMKLYKHHPLVELVSPRQSRVERTNRHVVEVDNLQELSIMVNMIRKTYTPRIFVHSYLPELLVKHGSEQVLRLIDFWRAEIKQTGHLEFFLLPKKTFSDFEKKLLAIVDGAIELVAEKSVNKFQNFFVPVRIARDRFHLKPIPYLIKDDQLIVMEPVAGSEEAVKRLAQRLLEDDGLKIVYIDAFHSPLSLNDLLLLKEVSGLTIAALKRVYPDKFDEVVLKIAAFVEQGLVKVARRNDDETPVTEKAGYKRKVLKKLRALGCVETKEVIDTISTYVSVNLSRIKEDQSLTHFLRELYARLYAYVLTMEYKKPNFEKALERYLIETTEMKPRIRKEGVDSYVVEFGSCMLCVGMQANAPICGCLAHLISASSTVLMGREMACHEIECCAARGRKCVFKLRPVS